MEDVTKLGRWRSPPIAQTSHTPLTHKNEELLAVFFFSSDKANENTASNHYVENTPFNSVSKWSQPESIAEVVEMLDLSEEEETLALIRRGSIPPFVFKAALLFKIESEVYIPHVDNQQLELKV